MKTKHYLVALGALLMLALSGCATTRLTSHWQNSKFSGGPIKSVLVFSVSKQAGVRRIFEDELVRELEANGVKAVPSYTMVPEDGEVPRERLGEALKQSGLQGALVYRLVRVQRETQIYPGGYMAPPYTGFYGYYSSAWFGFYDPPQVYSYDVVTAETNLFDAATDALVWSGTTETFAPRDLRKDTQDLAKVVIKSLRDGGMI